MKSFINNTSYPFLNGGGEMGELTRNHDWTNTTLGTPDQWPQSLRTTLSLILNATFPMFLFWGKKHLCFYNDAYRPSLGNDGKHPNALGKPGAAVWPESWAFIKPLIDQVLSGQGATWSEDQLLPIYRNGQLEEAYWTFSSVSDESGNPAGILVTPTETTQKVAQLNQLIDSKDQLEFAIEAAELGIWDLNPATGKFTGNDRLKEWFGLAPSDDVPLDWAVDVMAESDQQRVAAAIQRALEYTSGGHYDIDYTIVNPITRIPRIVRAKGKAWFNNDQTPYRFNGTLQDITQQVMAQRQLEESEQQSRSLVEQSPVRTILLTGEAMIITRANEPVLRSWGKDASAIGKPLLEVLPELKGQAFPQLLAEVYATGVPYNAYETPVTLTRASLDDTQYYDFTYQPMHTTSGTIYGVLSTAVDVTDRVKARKQLEESERNLRSIILQSPVAMSIIKGPSYRVEIANERMFDIWGKKAETVLNKPIFEALPEAKGQSLEETFHHVYTTGETYRAYELPVTLSRKGVLETIYLNVVCEPIRDGNGTISGIMQVAIDVTEQVLARQNIEASEARFRSLIEEASIASCLFIGKDMVVDVANKTMLGYWGKGDSVLNKPLSVGVPELIGQPFLQLLDTVLTTGQTYTARDAEVQLVVDGHLKTYYFDFTYKALRDENGLVYGVMDTAIDVTEKVLALRQVEASEARYRILSVSLEQQVQERTEELKATNEELAANNEKLTIISEDIAAANERLEEANRNLTRSNQNLEQFAYIASHDLQEPLRKIQSFGDLLKSRYAGSSGEELDYLDRMQSAASRMSLLIKDLLAFSRISTRQATQDAVALSTIVERALENLSVAIEESQADINVGTLPTVQGDATQLEQLFQNLLSNALKFSQHDKTGTTPQIQVSAYLIMASELPPSINPTRQASFYHQLEVIDNGIGFDEKYTNRIFQVFQRLHGKNEFSGTGIGLAICQKVVDNHGGAITATSQPGKGATFCVYLPA